MKDRLSDNHGRLHALRMEYTRAGLDEAALEPDPVTQFGHWMREAVSAEIRDPNAMTLATATPEGIPSSRIVLLKDFSREGFTFFTNYQSRKGRELLANPQACLLFFWKELERQVVIEGFVEPVERSVSQAYFSSRPRESQLGAWASRQSEVIPGGRSELEALFQVQEKHFAGQEIPCPEQWGGYCLTPIRLEFWQGRPNRMHDRIAYVLNQGEWSRARLSP